MLWVDYREKLGVGFNDTEKFELLQSKVIILLQKFENEIIYDGDSYFLFCLMTGIEHNNNFPSINIITNILSRCDSIKEFLSYYIAFVNTYKEKINMRIGKRENFINILQSMMDQTKIPCDIQKDKKNNQYFVFPQGAPELDDALVSAPLEWLLDYPETHKTFMIALKQYSNGEYLRDTADNFRKALESFLQEFFENHNNLDTNIGVTGKYLKEKGADKEITDVLVKLIDLYKKLNDKIAKHNDKVDSKFLEFLMYQTGVFIRMLIVVKKAEP